MFLLLSCSELTLDEGTDVVPEGLVSAEKCYVNEYFVFPEEVKYYTENLRMPTASSIATMRKGGQGKVKLHKRSIRSIMPVNDEQGQASYYVVNFEPEGWIHLSADRRTEPILAYAVEGTFDIEISSEIGGLQIWSLGVIEGIRGIRERNEEQSEDIYYLWEQFENEDGYKLNEQEVEEMRYDDEGPGGGGNTGCTSFDQYVFPFGSQFTGRATWHQGNGYNDECWHHLGFMCTNDPDGNARVGCVALAIGQIMHYYSDNANYNWANVDDVIPTPTTADLLSDIGDAVNILYGCSNSNALSSSAQAALVNDFGYTNAKLASFNHTTVKNELSAGRVVYLSGCEQLTCLDGHAWVAEGYHSYRHCPATTSYLYLWMNWGWGSLGNGFFAHGNWNSQFGTYSYHRKMIYDIR